MRDYEIVYIFKSGFTPEEIEQKLERYHGVLTGADGEITAVEQWGKRQLAYPIRKESNGYYVIAQFTTPAALAEFERVLKLDEDLLRHLIVLSEGELPRLVRLEEGGAVDEDEDDEFDEDEDEEDEDEEDEDEEDEDEEDEDEEEGEDEDEGEDEEEEEDEDDDGEEDEEEDEDEEEEKD